MKICTFAAAFLLLAACHILSLRPAAAQNRHYRLWGTTYDGGAYTVGTFFRYTPQADSIEVMSDFYTTVMGGPKRPNSGVIWDSGKGVFYGTGTDGGMRPGASQGAIFSFRPSDSSFKTEYDCYVASSGLIPLARPTAAGSNTLWGTDFRGGTGLYGTLYEFNIATGVKTVRKNFSTNDSDGNQAYQGPVFAANGKLYGLTSGLGSSVSGVLYCYDTTLKVYTVKHRFLRATTSDPMSRLLAASNGKLYGTTTDGGAYNAGTLFQFDPVTDSFRVCQDFQHGVTGSGARGSLLEYAGGIWGMASGGGLNGRGTIYRYDTATGQLVNKLNLTDSLGSAPLSGLCLARDGWMYGAMNAGGTYGLGAIIAYDPVSGTARKCSSFNDTNGSHPYYATLTEAWTNDRPRLALFSRTDTLCAGERDSVDFLAVDADGDTLLLDAVISDTSMLAASAFRLRYMGSSRYRLVYAADSPHRDTGLVVMHAKLKDPYGGTTADSIMLRVYLRDCAPTPPLPAAVPAAGPGPVLKCFPNPVDKMLWLQLPISGDAVSFCSVYDLLGRVHPSEWEPAGGGRAMLHTAQLTTGAYMLRVETAAGRTYMATFTRY